MHGESGAAQREHRFKAPICKTEEIQFLLGDCKNMKEAHAQTAEVPSTAPGN